MTLKLQRHGIAIGLFALLLAIAGCTELGAAPPIPTKAQIIGTWSHLGPANAKAVVTFKPNDTFTISGIPKEVFMPTNSGSYVHLDWIDTIDLTGTWKINETYDPGGPYLNISIDPAANSPQYDTQVFAASAGDTLRLFAYVGLIDNDEEFAFMKAR